VRHIQVILVVVWYFRQTAMNPGGNINGILLSYEVVYMQCSAVGIAAS